MSSDRVGVHLTGRPNSSAAFAATRYSTYAAALGPNPPPTHGQTTRTAEGSSPMAPASAGCSEWGAWCDTHAVSDPSAGSVGTIRQPFVSIGTPARRWLTMSTSATTSAPSSGSVSSPKLVAKHTLLPAAGNNIGAPSATASAESMTGGRVSISTTTASTASTACARVSATTAATM